MDPDIEARLGFSGDPESDGTECDGLESRCYEVRRERLMMNIRSCLHAIAECCMPDGDTEIVKAACDAGMAAGFYGSGSAIAQGLTRKLQCVRGMRCREDEVLLQEMIGIGRDAGMKCRSVDTWRSGETASLLGVNS